MNYNFTEEQALIRDMVREFTEKNITPIAAELDKTHRFPSELIEPMGELGLFGFNMPEEFGGTNADTVSQALAIMEVSRAMPALGLMMGIQTGLDSQIILKYASDELKARILPDLIAGRKIASFCLTEPCAGSDASALQTTAVRQNDTYVLNGSKCFTTNSPVASVYVVFAMTDRSKGTKGISAFLVERDTPGLSVGPAEDKLGFNASPTAEVFFKDCVIPVGNLLGDEGRGFNIAMEALDTGRICVAAQGVGVAEAALDAAVDYTKQRIQFGKPISANQGIQWRIAELATELECAQLLMLNAASLRDRKVPCVKECAMAKYFCSKTAFHVSEEALQLLGGIGYTRSYPVERYMRDAKLLGIAEGTNEVQLIVISRSVLR